MLGLATEMVTVVAQDNPQNRNNSTTNLTAVDMLKFHQALFLVQTGSLDSTVDFKLQGSADNSTFTDLSGKAITQITASNKQALINIRSAELDVGPYRYVRGVLTVGNGTTNLTSVTVLGVQPRFEPASDDKAASVTQVLN